MHDSLVGYHSIYKTRREGVSKLKHRQYVVRVQREKTLSRKGRRSLKVSITKNEEKYILLLNRPCDRLQTRGL